VASTATSALTMETVTLVAVAQNTCVGKSLTFQALDAVCRWGRKAVPAIPIAVAARMATSAKNPVVWT